MAPSKNWSVPVAVAGETVALNRDGLARGRGIGSGGQRSWWWLPC